MNDRKGSLLVINGYPTAPAQVAEAPCDLAQLHLAI